MNIGALESLLPPSGLFPNKPISHHKRCLPKKSYPDKTTRFPEKRRKGIFLQNSPSQDQGVGKIP